VSGFEVVFSIMFVACASARSSSKRRGYVELVRKAFFASNQKGKGEMKTYWLLGKGDNTTKE
jgi:hypothetical protein